MDVEETKESKKDEISHTQVEEVEDSPAPISNDFDDEKYPICIGDTNIKNNELI